MRFAGVPLPLSYADTLRQPKNIVIVIIPYTIHLVLAKGQKSCSQYNTGSYHLSISDRFTEKQELIHWKFMYRFDNVYKLCYDKQQRFFGPYYKERE